MHTEIGAGRSIESSAMVPVPTEPSGASMEPVVAPQPTDATDAETGSWAPPTYRVHSIAPRGGIRTGAGELIFNGTSYRPS
jgi:hypothetical protein